MDNIDQFNKLKYLSLYNFLEHFALIRATYNEYKKNIYIYMYIYHEMIKIDSVGGKVQIDHSSLGTLQLTRIRG